MKAADWFREWNDVNVTNAKTVLVAIMQFLAFGAIQTMWCVAMIVQLRSWKPPQDVDFHTEFLYLELGALLALSGINLAGLGIKRTTDIDYQLAKNAGKTQNVQTGDNPVNVNTNATTSEMPVPTPPLTRPTRRQTAQVGAARASAASAAAVRAAPTASPAAAEALARAGPRAVVTDHDDGII
jgi:hypothetical protein